jgi:phosphate transport system protein
MTEDPLSPSDAPRGYDIEVRHLKERAGRMGDWALEMVHDGWRAYAASDLQLAQTVLDRDAELDHLDEEMEHATIAFLVLRQPAAVDLRTATALLKITTHLDRIGRLGFDMARLTAPVGEGKSPEVDQLLQRMDVSVEAMVRSSLDALANGNVDDARTLFRRDDEVDRLHRDVTRAIVADLTKESSSPARLAGHLLVARHFERIADNACKVAEKTIYAVTGQRRSEYLPRHPSRPYALEPTRSP